MSLTWDVVTCLEETIVSPPDAGVARWAAPSMPYAPPAHEVRWLVQFLGSSQRVAYPGLVDSVVDRVRGLAFVNMGDLIEHSAWCRVPTIR